MTAFSIATGTARATARSLTQPGAGGGAFSPASLFASGEQGAWYDPSDLSTMFQDTAGTTPVTTPGQAVARINDKSGRGNHLTQATVAARPLYQSGGGLHWLQFDGVDDGLVSSSVNMTATDKATVFSGVLVSGTGNQGLAYFGNGLAGSFDLLFMAGAAPRLRGRLTGTGTSAVSIAGNTAATNAAVYTVSFDIAGAAAGDETKLRKDGALPASSVEIAGPSGTGNFGTYAISVGQTVGVLLFSGRVYSLIVRGATSSAGEIASTEQYGATKAGVTL